MATPQQHYSWLANQPVQRKILLAISLLLALFLLDSLVSLYSVHQQDDNRIWAAHTYNVLLQIDRVQHAAQTSQIGLRGYMLNQHAEELGTYSVAVGDLKNSLNELRQLTADNPLEQSRVDRIETLITAWTREIDTLAVNPVRKVSESDPVKTFQAVKQIRDNYAAHRSARIEDAYVTLGQMADSERALLAVRTAKLERTLSADRIINIAFAVIGLLLALTIISLTFRLITRPIRRMTDLMTRLAGHDHEIEVRGLDRKDEIGEIARALQVFKQTAIETQQKTWLKSQVAALSNRLQEAVSHREFGEQLMSYLMPVLHAGVGLFYGYDAQRQRLDLLGSYGLQTNLLGADSYVPGEGLVGQCAVDRAPIILDEVPPNYLHIGSGSGSSLPQHITILPILLREQLLGVLELGSFESISSLHRQLLDELLPVVALTMENLNRAISTQDLLSQTREQADELRISSVTMRQQQSALRDTNDTLQAKTMELEEQSQRLLASEEELRMQADELQTSNEELRLKTDTLRQQKQRLEVLQRETEQKAQELARASQYKSDFLANMSHELRTPLNSLLILSRSLGENREGNLDTEQVESARIIYDSGSTLLRLINDILDLSKIEAGKMELALIDYPLQNLARSLQRNFEHVARDKKLDYAVVLGADIPREIHTDPARLEQIINNLLANAFKFTASGSVRVTIERPGADTSIPELVASQSPIAITVQDSGIGIPADKLERVFHAFEQADASTSRQFGGTGLGLSISRRLAELLGGVITLHSEEHRGSAFTLWLPERSVVDSEAVPSTPAPPRSATRAVATIAGIKDDRELIEHGASVILVVEDDLAFARILADMVRQKGYQVLHAADGEGGLELARHYRPLGILLDVMLPGMDGWTVIERLKSDDATQHIPVHFLSAADDTNRSRELGAIGFLTKPIDRESLNGALERLLDFARGQGKQHLLVVDDDEGARRAVQTLLQQQNLAIDEAVSAEDALQKMADTVYDCIVLDLGLPGMSGIELLEHLAKDHKLPPVVVYSGHELSREESLRIRQFTDSIVIKGARSPERLLDEVSLFLHSINPETLRPVETPLTPDELQGHRVLLVDDDMRNLFALSKVLRNWGLQVSMAQEGQKALQMLSEDDGVELVLMDIMMPGMDGYEAIRRIRAQAAFARLPIIALTAKAMRGDREQCLEAGANDYLPKPVDLDKLASMIRVWLRR